ncbi:type II toxin-antitoxin system HicB family antitoxin [Rhodococcus sp. TAF43]|uniref:type II toxin-antitoxin system HicB family antitoxin n=1 Tax=Rhodococcus sp. TAF43 TaxID=3237483 RepID=UPI003F9DD890
MKVTAKAARDGGWWVVEVPEVDGAFTQGRRLDQIPAMVADAVSLLEDVPADDVEVELDFDLGDPAALEEARQARAQVEAAARAQEEAARASRAAVAHLRHRTKLSVRDTAVVLGVSPQRVSQLDHAAS